MRMIGVVGGIASGKSEVTRHLERLGALQLDADRAGHRVLEEPEVRAALVARWGPGIVQEDGSLSRREIGRQVFGNHSGATEDRVFLERIMHPRIAARLQEQLKEAQAAGRKVAVLDAPLLFEAGWDAMCDEILFVAVPDCQRLERALRRGWTEAEFRQREAAQMSLENKRQRSHTIIDNSRSLEDTFDQLNAVWSSWVRSEETDAT